MFSRAARYVVRSFLRAGVAVKRTAEALAIFFGGMPRKVERFNRLIESDVQRAVEQIGRAEVVVGIPFHREAANLGAVVRRAQADLEARGERAAIVIVGERKTHSLLADTALPSSSNLVEIVRFAKPFGFGQKPGLGRRSWTHWAIFQIAGRLRSDLVFIDADVRNTQGWVDLYLKSILDGADIAVANYIRSFGSDDAMVHIWDRLIFGALFGRWIEFRQGGDYAVSRRIVPEVLNDPLILREESYTLDGSVMAHVAAAQGRIDFVWLGRKEHEPVAPEKVFKRLPNLVQSVFDDIEVHLPAVLAMPDKMRPVLYSHLERRDNPAMQELVGDGFLQALFTDLRQRIQGMSDVKETRKIGPRPRPALVKVLFQLCVTRTQSSRASQVDVTAREWARATFRFLNRYIWSAADEKDKHSLATAYVPVLEAGALGFLNRTSGMRYQEAMDLLETEYLREFRKAWRDLARRRIFHRAGLWRRLPDRGRLGKRMWARFESTRPDKRGSAARC